MNRPIIFGEVLFDCFSDGTRVLGGAPFNVAWNLQSLGMNPLLISRVGDDQFGEDILNVMKKHNMDCSSVQIDKDRPTGVVNVTLNGSEPSYDIVEGAAFDFIDANKLAVNDETGFLYHGSLALRNKHSRDALAQIRNQLDIPIFMDVNLRAPWFDIDDVCSMVKSAKWCKINEKEFSLIKSQLSENDSNEGNGQYFQGELETIYLTKGKFGASVLSPDNNGYNVVPASLTKVVDCIGAGDAFCSIIILGLFKQWDIKTIFDRAQDFASEVVGIKGAISTDLGFYEKFRTIWNI